MSLSATTVVSTAPKVIDDSAMVGFEVCIKIMRNKKTEGNPVYMYKDQPSIYPELGRWSLEIRPNEGERRAPRLVVSMRCSKRPELESLKPIAFQIGVTLKEGFDENAAKITLPANMTWADMENRNVFYVSLKARGLGNEEIIFIGVRLLYRRSVLAPLRGSLTESMNAINDALFSGLKNDDLTDLTLEFDDGHVNGHAIVVAASSCFVKELLKRQGGETRKVWRVRGINKRVGEIILETLYKRKLPPVVSVRDLRAIYEFAASYHFVELVEVVASRLVHIDLDADEIVPLLDTLMKYPTEPGRKAVVILVNATRNNSTK